MSCAGRRIISGTGMRGRPFLRSVSAQASSSCVSSSICRSAPRTILNGMTSGASRRFFFARSLYTPMQATATPPATDLVSESVVRGPESRRTSERLSAVGAAAPVTGMAEGLHPTLAIEHEDFSPLGAYLDRSLERHAAYEACVLPGVPSLGSFCVGKGLMPKWFLLARSTHHSAF